MRADRRRLARETADAPLQQVHTPQRMEGLEPDDGRKWDGQFHSCRLAQTRAPLRECENRRREDERRSTRGGRVVGVNFGFVG